MKISEFQRFIEQYPQYELLFEYVRGSCHMVEYYRFIPETRWSHTHAQRMVQLEFLLASSGAYGSRGFEELDGDILPVVAVEVARRMKGQKYSNKGPVTESSWFLRKCKKLLKMGRTQDPEKQRIKEWKRLAYAQESIRPQGEPLVIPEVKPEKKKEKTLTYDQVGQQARWLASEYARNRREYERNRRFMEMERKKKKFRISFMD